MNEKRLLELAEAAKAGDTQALRSLRSQLLGAPLAVMRDGTGQRWATALFMARMLINLTWVNLFTDSKFSVEESDVVPIARAVGGFICAAATENKGEESITALQDFAAAFHATISRLNTEGEKPWAAKVPPSAVAGKEDS